MVSFKPLSDQPCVALYLLNSLLFLKQNFATYFYRELTSEFNHFSWKKNEKFQ